MKLYILAAWFYCLLFSSLHAIPNVEYIRNLYNINMSDEVNTAGNVALINKNTVICKLSEKALAKLLERRLPGYSEWRKVPPNESHGNRDIVVDGFVEKSLFEAHRVAKGFHQRIIVNTSKRKIIFFSA